MQMQVDAWAQTLSLPKMTVSENTITGKGEIAFGHLEKEGSWMKNNQLGTK